MAFRKKYLKKQKSKTFIGTVQGSDRGFVFVVPENAGLKDFFVPARATCGAYHGDKVLAESVPGTEDEAQIIKILERSSDPVVGTFVRERPFSFVYPDNVKQPKVYISREAAIGVKSGQKVVCKITSYPRNKAPGGKIIEILGEEGDLLSEELSVIRSYGLEEEFPQNVLDEARAVAAEEVTTDGREDLRDKLIITIDGEDTRDIDDGVSLERRDENYLLGVHIADVSHYVKRRTALDENAYSRGTSVYFPDRVLPMLPPELSNGACSLNEGEDRYAMSVLMTFTPDGERLDYKIYNSVIRSSHRTTYPEITALCSKDPDICRKYGDLVEVAEDMQKLCLAIEKRREKLGSVTLDVKEAHVYVDDDGEIVIPDATRTISERIIEQFMISANETVAEFLQSRNAPCLFRVHEIPSPEKTSSFFSFLRDLGLNPKADVNEPTPADFQNVLKSAEDKPYYYVVNKVMLRSMQKARYCEENLQHFGLASKCYCHFTSPIRRYPDLFVHRSLKSVLSHGDLYPQQKSAHTDGVHLSQRERIADECERRVDDLYKLYYMSEKLGEEFDAVISGVTNFGVFCELANSVEGLIPLEDLPADKYEFYEDKFTLKGKKNTFKLGASVKVKVADCDLGRMRVLFKLCL